MAIEVTSFSIDATTSQVTVDWLVQNTGFTQDTADVTTTVDVGNDGVVDAYNNETVTLQGGQSEEKEVTFGLLTDDGEELQVCVNAT